MSREMRADYIDLLAASWESDEPGTLPLPVEVAAKVAAISVRSLVNLRSKFPRCFVEVGSKLVNEKLHNQYLEWLDYIEKQRRSGIEGNKKRWGNSIGSRSQADRSASASASAFKDLNPAATPAAVLRKRSKTPKQQQKNIEARNYRSAQEASVLRESLVGSGPGNVAEFERTINRIADKMAIRRPKSEAEYRRIASEQQKALARKFPEVKRPSN